MQACLAHELVQPKAPQSILAQDKLLGAHRLDVPAENVTIIGVEEMFAQ